MNQFNDASIKTTEAELDLQGSKWQSTSFLCFHDKKCQKEDFLMPFLKNVMILLQFS